MSVRLSHTDAIAFVHGGLRSLDMRALTVLAEEARSLCKMEFLHRYDTTLQEKGSVC